MAWELLAVWAIVVVTLVWFVRDERRQRAEAELERAARYYAHAPKYRHIPVDRPAELPVRRQGGLSETQRDFLAKLAASRPKVAPPDRLSTGQ